MTAPEHLDGLTLQTIDLLRIPFVFSQDDLLTTAQFIKEADLRGYQLSETVLAELHEFDIMCPLIRIDDEPQAALRVDAARGGGNNPRGWVTAAAAEGRLRDPQLEGYLAAHPYKRPPGSPRGWQNGYLYSSWQLLQLNLALTMLGWRRRDDYQPAPEIAAQHRSLTMALCALAPVYLPSVLGTISLTGRETVEQLWQFQDKVDPQTILATAGFDPGDLVTRAEKLLRDAHSQDPMIQWLPLLRHAPFRAWSRMRGAPLHAMWNRAGAELLLLAHEDLAEGGVVAPLRDLTGETWFDAQHDRLIPRYDEADGLDRALAVFGLSPHPRVILIVEGATEMEHIPSLLADFGLGEPQKVRVQNGHGAKVKAHLVARYGITPRIGRKQRDGWDLNAPLTALMIIMDPEGLYATPEACQEERQRLQKAVCEEVQAQGADISQEDLDLLVTVSTWGTDTYELANFDDDELVEAIREVALSRRQAAASSPEWEAALRNELATARQNHHDLKVVCAAIKLGDPKVQLAKLLWPVLRQKCAAEQARGVITTPVWQLIHDVQDRVATLDRVNCLAEPVTDTP